MLAKFTVIHTPFQIFPTQGTRPEGNGNLYNMFEIIDLIISIENVIFFAGSHMTPRKMCTHVKVCELLDIKKISEHKEFGKCFPLKKHNIINY